MIHTDCNYQKAFHRPSNNSRLLSCPLSLPWPLIPTLPRCFRRFRCFCCCYRCSCGEETQFEMFNSRVGGRVAVLFDRRQSSKSVDINHSLSLALVLPTTPCPWGHIFPAFGGKLDRTQIEWGKNSWPSWLHYHRRLIISL